MSDSQPTRFTRISFISCTNLHAGCPDRGVPIVFLNASRHMLEQFVKLGHNRFLPSALDFFHTGHTVAGDCHGHCVLVETFRRVTWGCIGDSCWGRQMFLPARGCNTSCGRATAVTVVWERSHEPQWYQKWIEVVFLMWQDSSQGFGTGLWHQSYPCSAQPRACVWLRHWWLVWKLSYSLTIL
jgi:hypothetical protein